MSGFVWPGGVWVLARHWGQWILKVPRLRVRVTIQVWKRHG